MGQVSLSTLRFLHYYTMILHCGRCRIRTRYLRPYKSGALPISHHISLFSSDEEKILGLAEEEDDLYSDSYEQVSLMTSMSESYFSRQQQCCRAALPPFLLLLLQAFSFWRLLLQAFPFW